MIYFDNAASSYPKPDSVIKNISYYLRKNGANPGRSGHSMSLHASELVYDVRVQLSKLFSIQNPENIAFVPNATYGLNILIQGLLQKGDHVIVTDLEHNSVLRPVYLMQKKGVEIDIAEIDLYDDNNTVNIINKLCKNNTKLVICTQCSNVCGKIMPIEQIRQSLKSSVKLLVDGSQGAGFIPTDLEKSGVDYYCAPSHKGLLGPQGSGFIAVLSDLPEPILAGGTGSESFNKFQPEYMPDIFECGTLPVPILAGLSAGIDYIKKRGIENIFEHKRKLTEYFYLRINEVKNIQTYIDYPNGDFIGATCFNIKDTQSEKVGEFLNSHGICVRCGYHCAPLFHKKMNTENIGMVRVSFGENNTFSEIDYFIKILNKF